MIIFRIIFSTNDQKHITKNELIRKKHLKKLRIQKKCVKCVTQSNRRLFNENFRK